MPQACSASCNVWTCASIVALMTHLHGCGTSNEQYPTPKPTPAPGPPPSPEDECAAAQHVRPFGVMNATTYEGKVLGNVTLGVPSDQDLVWACLCGIEPNGWDKRGRNSTDGIPLSVTPLNKNSMTNFTDVICTTFDYGARPVPATGSYAITSIHLPLFAPQPAPFLCTKASGECIYVHINNKSYGSWALAQKTAQNMSWRNAPPVNFTSSAWFSLDGPTCAQKNASFNVEYTAGAAGFLRINRRCEETGVIVTEITYLKSMKLLEGDYDDPYVLVLQFEDVALEDTLGRNDAITTVKRSSWQHKIVERSIISAGKKTPWKAKRFMFPERSVEIV